MFKRVLIANRGEIAVRIMRACREMGIESVAVFSDVDRKSLQCAKPTTPTTLARRQRASPTLTSTRFSMLRGERGRRRSIPGYGFLSENADFARACRDAGFKFIGPSPESMEMMGRRRARAST